MNGGKVCVSVRAGSREGLLQEIRRASEYADIIEIRLDFSDDPRAVTDSLPETGKPYLLTLRPAEQGGAREITAADRAVFWAHVANRRDFLIDVEYDMAIEKADVISYHNFDGTPADLGVLYNSLRDRANGAMIKIACTARSVTDAIPVWNVLERAKKDKANVIPIAMGEAGAWTRILGLAHGAAMTYASLDDEGATAAGQLTAKDLIKRYRIRQLSRDTRVYAVIGHPVSHSLSPVIHNAAFQAVGEDAVFIRLPVVELEEFMRRMVLKQSREVELNFAGFAVTMPHKQSIIPLLDEIDETAEAVGAVNTVDITGDGLKGYNTDVQGFIGPLKRRISDLRDCRVAIIGAGGAARACMYGLRQERAEVTVLARDLGKAEKLANEFGSAASPIPTDIKGYDVVVNATPIGMNSADASPVSAAQMTGLKVVYDLVTSREATALIRETVAAGIDAIRGEEMLLEQGAAQFEIWTGRETPRRAMAEALSNL
jgi:3-dehydroquinate dehydratase / shikimate dehydrogenase